MAKVPKAICILIPYLTGSKHDGSMCTALPPHPGLNSDMQWSLLFSACFSSQTTIRHCWQGHRVSHQDHWVWLPALHRTAPRWASTVQDLFLIGNLGINNLFSGPRSLAGTSLGCIWDRLRLLGWALARETLLCSEWMPLSSPTAAATNPPALNSCCG